MDKNQADELVADWHRLPSRPDAGSAYQNLSKALLTLPDDVIAAGVALISDVPTVLALGKACVFTVSVDAAIGDRARSSSRFQARLSQPFWTRTEGDLLPRNATPVPAVDLCDSLKRKQQPRLSQSNS